MHSPNRLKQIGLALHSYHDVHGEFPPAVIRDVNGGPMHSWRVLLLPYLGAEDVYKRYDFSSKWDSPHNLKAAQDMPDVYCGSGEAGNGMTPYLAVTGEGMAWPGTGKSNIASFHDGAGETIVVIELPAESVLWTRPVDVHVVGNKDIDLGRSMSESCNVLLADGSVWSISTSIPSNLLIPAFTKGAGDEFDTSLLRHAQ